MPLPVLPLTPAGAKNAYNLDPQPPQRRSDRNCELDAGKVDII